MMHGCRRTRADQSPLPEEMQQRTGAAVGAVSVMITSIVVPTTPYIRLQNSINHSHVQSEGLFVPARSGPAQKGRKGV